MAAQHRTPQTSGESSASCADKLKVLADPTRLAVLEVLLGGPQYVAQLGSALQVEQSLLSHHLRVLRDAGLVEAQREGKRVRYQLAKAAGVRASAQAIHLGCCDLSFPVPPRSAAVDEPAPEGSEPPRSSRSRSPR